MLQRVCAGKGRSQKEKGRSYLLAQQSSFFILPFAFLLCLTPFARAKDRLEAHAMLLHCAPPPLNSLTAFKTAD
jgi:hypothetical protein